MLLLAASGPKGHAQTLLATSISGTVVNSVTHEALGRVLVYTAGQEFAALTDDHGHFELTLTPPSAPEGRTIMPRMVTLEARKPGFLTARGHESQTIDLSQFKEVTILLVPEAFIIGRVKFPSAEAGDQVQVRLYRREVRDGAAQWGPVAETPTRANGEFRFAELRAGEYKLFTREALDRDPLTRSVSGPVFGFPPRFFANGRDFASADTIIVRAGESFTADLSLAREPYYDVNIPVVASERSDMGVDVSVQAQGHRGPGYELGYNPERHAISGSLPNGTYNVEAFTFGPAAASGASSITISNGVVNAPSLTVTPHPSISVTIHSELTGNERTLQQAPQVYLSLLPAEEFAGDYYGGQYQGSSSGGQITGVKPGRYWVQVQSQQSGMYIASVTANGKDLTRTPLIVPFGASVPAIDVVVRNDAGQITASFESPPTQTASAYAVGRVPVPRLLLGGAPGPRVYCIPAGDGAPRELHPMQEGNYVLSELAPGNYRIVAFEEAPEFEYRNPEAMRPYESMGQLVRLSAGEKLQVQLKPLRSE